MYRDHLYAAQCRKRELERQAPLSYPPTVLRLYGYRAARAAAGVAGLVSFVAMLGHIPFGGRHLSGMLIGAWVVSLITFMVAWPLAQAVMLLRLRRAYAPVNDPFVEVSRLERGGVRLDMIRRTHRLERASLIYPLIFLCLLAPLTLHLLVALPLLGVSLSEFSGWMLMSFVLVGHAHLGLVLFAASHVLRLQHEMDCGARVSGASRGAVALLWVVAASTLPGAVLLFIPPLLVAVTGAIFVPWMFHWSARRATFERQLLRLAAGRFEDALLGPARAGQPEPAQPTAAERAPGTPTT